MERVELEAAVARVIAEVYCGTGGMASGGTHGDLLADRAAAAAIRVVLAEACREMRATFTHEATNGDQARAWALGRVLAVLAMLEPPPPV